MDPTVQAELNFPPSYGDSATGFPAGDVDGDGHDDLFVSSYEQIALGEFADFGTVFYGPLPRAAGDAWAVSLPQANVGTNDIRPVGDVNGDGRPVRVVAAGAR